MGKMQASQKPERLKRPTYQTKRGIGTQEGLGDVGVACQKVAEVKADSSDPHDNMRILQEIVTIGEWKLKQKGEFYRQTNWNAARVKQSSKSRG